MVLENIYSVPQTESCPLRFLLSGQGTRVLVLHYGTDYPCEETNARHKLCSREVGQASVFFWVNLFVV